MAPIDDPKVDPGWAMGELPRAVVTLASLIDRDHGKAAVQEFLETMLAHVGGAMVAALGRQRAIELMEDQLEVTHVA